MSNTRTPEQNKANHLDTIFADLLGSQHLSRRLYDSTCSCVSEHLAQVQERINTMHWPLSAGIDEGYVLIVRVGVH